MNERSERKQECARATIAASQTLESAIDELDALITSNPHAAGRISALLQGTAEELAIVCEYVREEVL